jgi:hypothetical protein
MGNLHAEWVIAYLSMRFNRKLDKYENYYPVHTALLELALYRLWQKRVEGRCCRKTGSDHAARKTSRNAPIDHR